MEHQRIHDRLDQINKEIEEIKIIMAKNTASLELHMYRTELNEEAIDLMRTTFKPVAEHVAFVNGVAKAVVFTTKVIGAGAALATIASVLRLFHII